MNSNSTEKKPVYEKPIAHLPKKIGSLEILVAMVDCLVQYE